MWSVLLALALCLATIGADLTAPPVARDDIVDARVNIVAMINVLVNDDYAKPLPLGEAGLSVVDAPFYGTATLMKGAVRGIYYVPGTDFVGQDFFHYLLCDEGAVCAVAKVIVNVEAPATGNVEGPVPPPSGEAGNQPPLQPLQPQQPPEQQQPPPSQEPPEGAGGPPPTPDPDAGRKSAWTNSYQSLREGDEVLYASAVNLLTHESLYVAGEFVKCPPPNPNATAAVDSQAQMPPEGPPPPGGAPLPPHRNLGKVSLRGVRGTDSDAVDAAPSGRALAGVMAPPPPADAGTTPGMNAKRESYAYVAQLGADGALLWEQQIGANDDGQTSAFLAVAFDTAGSGNVVAVGSTSANIYANNAGNGDAFVTLLSAQRGTVLGGWQVGSTEHDEANGVAVIPNTATIVEDIAVSAIAIAGSTNGSETTVPSAWVKRLGAIYYTVGMESASAVEWTYAREDIAGFSGVCASTSFVTAVGTTCVDHGLPKHSAPPEGGDRIPAEGGGGALQGGTSTPMQGGGRALKGKGAPPPPPPPPVPRPPLPGFVTAPADTPPPPMSVTVQLDAESGALKWESEKIDGVVTAVTVDSSGDVFVTGYRLDNAFVMKLRGDSGALVWEHVSPMIEARTYSITLDKDQNVVVTGTAAGEVVVLQMASADGLLLCRFSFGSPDGLSPSAALAVVSLGGPVSDVVALTGFTEGQLFTPPAQGGPTGALVTSTISGAGGVGGVNATTPTPVGKDAFVTAIDLQSGAVCPPLQDDGTLFGIGGRTSANMRTATSPGGFDETHIDGDGDNDVLSETAGTTASYWVLALSAGAVCSSIAMAVLSGINTPKTQLAPLQSPEKGGTRAGSRRRPPQQAQQEVLDPSADACLPSTTLASLLVLQLQLLATFSLIAPDVVPLDWLSFTNGMRIVNLWIWDVSEEIGNGGTSYCGIDAHAASNTHLDPGIIVGNTLLVIILTVCSFLLHWIVTSAIGARILSEESVQLITMREKTALSNSIQLQGRDTEGAAVNIATDRGAAVRALSNLEQENDPYLSEISLSGTSEIDVDLNLNGAASAPMLSSHNDWRKSHPSLDMASPATVQMFARTPLEPPSPSDSHWDKTLMFRFDEQRDDAIQRVHMRSRLFLHFFPQVEITMALWSFCGLVAAQSTALWAGGDPSCQAVSCFSTLVPLLIIVLTALTLVNHVLGNESVVFVEELDEKDETWNMRWAMKSVVQWWKHGGMRGESVMAAFDTGSWEPRHVGKAHHRIAYAPIYEAFNDRAPWYALVILTEGAVCGCIGALLSNAKAQVLLLLASFLIFGGVFMVYKPFHNRGISVIQTFVFLINLIVVVLLTPFAFSQADGQGQLGVTVIMLEIVAVLALCAPIYMDMIMTIYYQRRVRRSQQHEDLLAEERQRELQRIANPGAAYRSPGANEEGSSEGNAPAPKYSYRTYFHFFGLLLRKNLVMAYNGVRAGVTLWRQEDSEEEAVTAKSMSLSGKQHNGAAPLASIPAANEFDVWVSDAIKKGKVGPSSANSNSSGKTSTSDEFSTGSGPVSGLSASGSGRSKQQRRVFFSSAGKNSSGDIPMETELIATPRSTASTSSSSSSSSSGRQGIMKKTPTATIPQLPSVGSSGGLVMTSPRGPTSVSGNGGRGLVGSATNTEDSGRMKPKKENRKEKTASKKGKIVV